MLIGLIDGDGCINVHKTTKGYIKINLTIEFNIRDLSILQYIHSILKLGKITTYSKFGICKLIINRTDIQEILFPLFLYHKLFFLTNVRREQFNKAMHILQNNLKLFNEIPSSIPNLFSLPETALGYIKLPFFNN
jgi:LAGLIDADG endonuclease